MFNADWTIAAFAMAANLLVAYVFMKSARVKWDNPDNFALYLGRILGPALPDGLVGAMSYGVMIAESFLVLIFALNLGSPYRQGMAILLLASFTVFLLLHRESTREEGCACFGEGSRLNRYPVARNLVLMALVLAPLWLDAKETPRITILHGTLFIALALIDYGIGFLRRRDSLQPTIPAEAEEDDRPVLFVSYKFKGFKEADRLLFEAASRPIVVVLDAPPWIFEAKRERWSSHRVLAAEAPLPGEAPFVLVRNAKGGIKRYGEWAAFLRR